MAASRATCSLCGVEKFKSKLQDKSSSSNRSELPDDTDTFETYFVNISTEDEPVEFRKATRDYIDAHFPDLDKKPYKVPSAFDYHQDRKLDFAVDENVEAWLNDRPKIVKILEGPNTHSEILKDRRQKEAVNKVATAIYSWGMKNGMPMFVISEFKFESFLRHVVKKGNKSEFEKLKPKDICDVAGDHDIVVISKQKGIIFLQVKSVTSKSSGNTTKRKQLVSALKQIEKDKRVIKTMNRDLPFVKSLPTLGFVAVPNLSNRDVVDVNVCARHREIILTSDHLMDEVSFSQWWTQKLQLDVVLQEEAQVMSLGDYKELCGRYVGLASAVKYRTISDAINNVGNRVSVLLLTPEQNNVLTEDRRLNILLGDYGTGKSLLIVEKATQLAKKLAFDIVYVISFATVSSGSGKVQEESDNSVDLLEKMLKFKGQENLGTNLFIRSFYEHLTAIENREGTEFPQQPFQYPLQLCPDFLSQIMRITLNMHPSKTVHFLFDEIPICIGKSELGGWDDFEAFCMEYTQSTIWMSIAAYSYALKVDEKYPCLEEHLPTSFKRKVFKICMRMPRNGFNLVKAVRKFKGDGHFAITECGNVIDGPFPVWYELTPCTCEGTSEGVPSPYHCDCVGERLKIILRDILKEVTGVKLKDIAIILHDTSARMTQFLTGKVEEACASLKVRVNFKVSSVAQRSTDLERVEDPNSGAITLVDFWSYKGNEDKVVIYMDPYGGPLVWNIESRWHGYQDVGGTLARAKAQIFYVTWPDEERRPFCLDLVKTLEEKASKSDDPFGRDFMLGVAKAIRNGREGHKWEGRNFMDYLVKEGVIERRKYTT